jgi:hypothetical protein
MLGLKEWNSLLREPEPTGECSSTVDLLQYLMEPFKQRALVECFTCAYIFAIPNAMMSVFLLLHHLWCIIINPFKEFMFVL